MLPEFQPKFHTISRIYAVYTSRSVRICSRFRHWSIEERKFGLRGGGKKDRGRESDRRRRFGAHVNHEMPKFGTSDRQEQWRTVPPFSQPFLSSSNRKTGDWRSHATRYTRPPGYWILSTTSLSLLPLFRGRASTSRWMTRLLRQVDRPLRRGRPRGI